jgi:hypothetical protein
LPPSCRFPPRREGNPKCRFCPPPAGLIRVHWSGKNGTPRLESPLTPSLSPLLKGGEGEGSGGMQNAGEESPSPRPSPPFSRGERVKGVGGFCLQKALSARRTRVADVYPYQKPRRRSHFANSLSLPLRVFENRRNFSPPPLGSPCRQGEPSLSGSPHAVGQTCRQGKPNLCAVPLAKRGEPAGGGQKRHFRTPSANPLTNAPEMG